MTKKLTKREIITEETTFKVEQIMENQVYNPHQDGRWCDTCNYWRKKENSEMKYCLEHQKEFDELLKKELEEALKDIEE